jgi:hypothetical protein
MTNNIAVIEQEANEALSENRRELTEESAKINSVPDLSEEAKTRYVGEARERAQAKYAEIIDGHDKVIAEQLDSLFRGSALYRPDKWGRRADYRRRTIEKALGNLAETYGSKAVAHDGTNGHGSLSSQRPTPI